MKKMSVIGMSVATAALLMSGCGSSSSSSGTAGDDVINSLKKPMEMTDQNVTNVLAFLEDQFSQFGGLNTKVAALKANAKAVQDANFALVEGEPTPCEISGTMTYTSSDTVDENGYRDEWSYVYDNCVETNSRNTIDDIPLNRRTRNGTETDWYAYSNDGNISTDTYGGADNYTDIFDNNETAVVSSTNTYQNTAEWSYERTETSYRNTFVEDGVYSREDINASGEIVYSEKGVAENFNAENYEFDEGRAGSLTADGGMTYYENGVAVEGVYFNNLVLDWTRMSNEKTVILNGTAGSLCLGGSVSMETTTAMKENQVDYVDGDNVNGPDVLPYAGDISLTGADSVTATVGFDTNDTNHTSATVTIGTNEPTTYTRWSDMTSGSTCSFDLFFKD
jgi:hypothetical protein